MNLEKGSANSGREKTRLRRGTRLHSRLFWMERNSGRFPWDLYKSNASEDKDNARSDKSNASPDKDNAIADKGNASLW
ncbi:hypothetical protein [Bhargavaea cecembensis]|uniref:hypothetical protein n=1 Tax=Bhargavaea cecembensis TaxID=394098 RepID=UPI001177ABC8|nr:hypothetical protein [Bhargavaea cecembensis]